MDGLRAHLQKAEVEYIAKHGGGYPQTFKWDKDIESHIKEIGFKIKERFPSDDMTGEWVRVSQGVAIFLNDGFICK